jgi:protein-tyrosine phosphatase
MNREPDRDPSGFGFRWAEVGAGRLALTHRPRLRAIPYFPKTRCDRVVTLLSEREGAEQIGALVREAGMAWSWIPLPGGRPPEGRVSERARAGVRELSDRLDAGESILLHCSAGIHRTGMMAYALFRGRGSPPAEALARVELLRPVTAQGLSSEQLRWGDQAAPR